MRCLKIFSILSASDHFVQPSGIICAAFEKGIMENICEKLF